MWLANGANFPGQQHFRRAYQRTQESLTVIREGLPSLTAVALPPAALDTLQELVVAAQHYNVEQYVVLGVQQLVGIALKALSLSTNNSTTAIVAANT